MALQFSLLVLVRAMSSIKHAAPSSDDRYFHTFTKDILLFLLKNTFIASTTYLRHAGSKHSVDGALDSSSIHDESP